MSAINGLGATPASNSGATQQSGLKLAQNAPASFAEAFSLSLSQQVNSNGTTSDEMFFYASGQDSQGDGVATVSMSEGNSAQSAYQSMIESINSFGDIGHEGIGGTSADSPSQLDPVFSDLAKALGSNSGTVSMGMGALFPEQVLTQTQATQLQSSPPETLSQFVDSVVGTLRNIANADTNSGNTGSASA